MASFLTNISSRFYLKALNLKHLTHIKPHPEEFLHLNQEGQSPARQTDIFRPSPAAVFPEFYYIYLFLLCTEKDKFKLCSETETKGNKPNETEKVTWQRLAGVSLANTFYRAPAAFNYWKARKKCAKWHKIPPLHPPIKGNPKQK